MRFTLPNDEPVAVPCPRCARGSLLMQRRCLDLSFLCPGCRQRFSLAELAPVLDGASFARLAESVADRLADRV